MYVFIRQASFKLLPASEGVTQDAATSPHPRLTRVFQPSALLCCRHIPKKLLIIFQGSEVQLEYPRN